MDVPQRRQSFLAPFGVRPFRFQFAGDLTTTWGIEMEVIVLGWYILVETNSVLLLTLYGALQYIGTLIAPLLGMASDRFGHRNVLTAMRAVYAAVAVTLMSLAFLGALHPTYVLILAGVSGLIRASDNGVRNALSAEVLPPPLLMAGVGLLRITSDSARIVGALAGATVYAAIGMGPACLLFSAFYVIGTTLTFCVGPAPGSHGAVTRPSPWAAMREGMVMVWHTPPLLAAMWLAFLVNLTAWPWTLGLLPYFARNVLHVDQAGLGSLVASFSSGALIGSLLVSLLGRRIQPGRFMLVASVIWHALLLVFTHMPSMGLACAVLVVAGISQSMSMVPMAVMLLHIAGQRFRGRVMGVRMLAIYGLPMGLMIAGVLIPRFGFHATATLYCVGGLVATIAIGCYWRVHVWPRHLPANNG